MTIEPLVSIIVPAYNASATIANVIEALFAQTYEGPREIIVVDDGSGDNTAQIIQTFPGVTYQYQENAGPASARNRGARVAKGDFLFFTDSDCLPEPQWISKMLSGFSSESVVAVSGSYGIANASSVLARIIHQEIKFRHKTLMPEYPGFFGSYNVAVNREAFFRAGGFNAQYRRASGEDNDLSYKIIASGGRIRFLPEACVDHYHQERLSRYLKEQFRHGFWRVRMYQDHPQMLGGDGYTFWKDALEVPLAAGHLLVFAVPVPGGVLLVGFYLFEIVSGWWMMNNFFLGWLAGCVFWLRAFARTAGFFTGGFASLLNYVFRR